MRGGACDRAGCPARPAQRPFSKGSSHAGCVLDFRRFLGSEQALALRAKGFEQGAGNGVQRAVGEAGKGGFGIGIEISDGLGIHQHGALKGEGAGFVENDFPHGAEAGPDQRLADEDPGALHAGASQFVGEGQRDTERARAGNDKYRDHHLQGRRETLRPQPEDEASHTDQHDGGEVVAQQFLQRGHTCRRAIRSGQPRQQGIRPCLARFHDDRRGAEMDRARRDGAPCGKGVRIGLAVDPFQGKLGGF